MELRVSNVYTAQELKERIVNNDNRSTAMPYLLLLEEKEKYVASDEYDSGNVEDMFVENYTGDYQVEKTKEELIEYFEMNGYFEDEDDSKKQEIINSITPFRQGYNWRTRNVFLTDMGYQDHLDVNAHNLSEHRTYGIHAFRNKEIRSLYALIDSSIELQSRIRELEAVVLEFDKLINSYFKESIKRVDNLDDQDNMAIFLNTKYRDLIEELKNNLEARNDFENKTMCKAALRQY
jgi:hypothetical protein